MPIIEHGVVHITIIFKHSHISILFYLLLKKKLFYLLSSWKHYN